VEGDNNFHYKKTTLQNVTWHLRLEWILWNDLDMRFGIWNVRNLCICNIRLDLGEIGWKVVDWIHLAQDRGQWWALVNMVMNL
jgi:hypothetical protein